MRFLKLGIGLSQRGSWFAQAEAELTEHTLALTYPDGDAVFLLNPSAEGLSIPEVSAQASLPRRVAQNSIHRFHLFFRQAAGPPRSLPLQQSRQTVSFKATHPILHPPWRLPEQARHLRAGHALRDQKQPMKTMIVSRFFRTANLILQSENDRGRVRNGKWFHSSMKPQSQRYTQLLMSPSLITPWKSRLFQLSCAARCVSTFL